MSDTDKHLHDNKVAVISGGTGYVGSATALKLAMQGMRVALVYNRASDKEVSTILAGLSGWGHKAYRCDLTDVSLVNETVDRIENEIGPVYVCVHTAGEKPDRKKLYLSSGDDVRKQFEVNVFGSFNFVSACATRLQNHGEGVIVGITTAGVVSLKSISGLGAYVPAKYALQGILAVLKQELSPYGVRVYSVAPGFMEGGMNSGLPKAFIDIIKDKSPTKTLATASLVAEKVSLLCSSDETGNDTLTVLVAPEITPE